MPSDSPMTGWNATDDESPVPIKVSKSEGPAMVLPSGDAIDLTQKQHGMEFKRNDVMPNARSMRLSAMFGIGIVLAVAAFSFGLGNIQGDLTHDTSIAITITADGTFSPSTSAAHPGDTITITNENADPQVLKSSNGRELFSAQVVFDTPFSFVIPDTAMGAYVYTSETLPADRTLTITVTPKTVATVQSAPSTQSDSQIPIPFGDGPVVPTTASSTPSSPVIDVQPTEHSSDAVVISLGGAQNTVSSSAASTNANVPTNPYTVQSGLEKISQTQSIIDNAQNEEQLHSGAPLKQLATHTPKTVTETGPAGALLLLIPALLGVSLFYRKVVA